jgi:hypothetical protein
VARALGAGHKTNDGIPFVQGFREVITVGFHPIANGQAME